jgi:hypothetical protein
MTKTLVVVTKKGCIFAVSLDHAVEGPGGFVIKNGDSIVNSHVVEGLEGLDEQK